MNEDLNKPEDGDVLLEYELLQSSSKTYNMIFYDEELLQEFTKNDCFGDSTFRIVPKVDGVAQVYILMGKNR